MGTKVHPIGFRLGITKDWTSRWFSDKESYADTAIEDVRIREFLKKKLEFAGLKSIEIERTENEIQIYLKVSNH